MIGHRWLPVAMLLAVGVLVIWIPPPAAASEGDLGAYVGADICLECHDGEELGEHDLHMRIEPFEVQSRQVGCEGCHGPGERHAEEGDAEFIRTFPGDGALAADACLSCHFGKNLGQWDVSVHAAEDVGCLNCHAIHDKKNPNATCKECHATEVAEFQLPSHHPLREGKMECASCHDVHMGTDAALKTAMRMNDLCYTCHQDKEGPFIFEHAPVEEDCSTCHVPHGSVANNLLTANEPMLCIQCHDFHFHAGYRSSESHVVEVGGNERENPYGVQGFNMAFTTSCTQCHSHVHGSDLPSQTVTNSNGLVR